MAELAIEVRGLTKRYGTTTALDGLDLEVPVRSLFGFLGPNGAGKTTAMRLLLGLSAPTDGVGTVFGHDIRRQSLEIRREVGYLPQQPRFHDDLTARELLRYARGFFPRDADSRVEDDIDEVLDLVGLTQKADQRVKGLSGGQRQRLGIAQAQIHRPRLLVLDEPAAALDPLGRRDVLDVMRRLKETTTVFFSTHILDDVQQVSDEVAILKDGRRVVQAPIDLLLAGSDPSYSLALHGDADAAAARLRQRPWVTDVRTTAHDGQMVMEVSVNDEDRAARDLLRVVLADDAVAVTEFRPRRSELEEVFIDVVEGSRR